MEKTWNSGFYSEERKKQIINVTNALAVNKVKTTTVFATYLKTIILYPETESPKDFFDEWFGTFAAEPKRVRIGYPIPIESTFDGSYDDDECEVVGRFVI